MTLPYSPLFSPLRPLRLGGRGSKLSLAMAEIARAAFIRAYPELAAPGAIEYIVIKTSGDATQVHGDVPLANFGSKELWTKEVEAALASGRIDIGLHCVKDVPSEIDPAFTLAAMLERGDARDTWISNDGLTLETAPSGYVIGTSSPRRQGIILSRRPDFKVMPIRGNIDMRLEKLRACQTRAIILAQTGLDRLRLDLPTAAVLEPEAMLPACGQGALCLETLSGNVELRAFLALINHAPTEAAIIAERAVLQSLGGDCHTPIGAYATYEGDQLHVRALVVRPDGTDLTQAEVRGPAADAATLGHRLGDQLRAMAPAGLFPATVPANGQDASRHTA